MIEIPEDKDLANCSISTDNKICTLVLKNGSKLRYFKDEAKIVYNEINGLDR